MEKRAYGYKVSFEYETNPDEFNSVDYIFDNAEDALNFARWAAYSKSFMDSGIKEPDSVYVFPVFTQTVEFKDGFGCMVKAYPIVIDEDNERFLASYHDIKENCRSDANIED